MSTPTRTQARNHYDRQRAVAAAAVAAVRSLFARRRPLAEVVETVAAYQYASALVASQWVAGVAKAPPLVSPAAFAGVSSYGLPISEPIIATIDKVTPAPLEPLPANWWDDAAAFISSVEQLIASEIQDTGRAAAATESLARGWTEYVRVLNPPSCARCTILAGRVYKWNDGFARHPLCDCVHVPVDDLEAAKAEGLIADPDEAFEKGQIGGYRTLDDGSRRFEPGLSAADMQAIRDGADPGQVVNARRGLRAPGITAAKTVDFAGHRVKVTTEGTTARAAWRKANPTRPIRLRPETIYQVARDPEDALRLLRLYGYLR